jgi:hypothetical protein
MGGVLEKKGQSHPPIVRMKIEIHRGAHVPQSRLEPRRQDLVRRCARESVCSVFVTVGESTDCLSFFVARSLGDRPISYSSTCFSYTYVAPCELSALHLLLFTLSPPPPRALSFNCANLSPPPRSVTIFATPR